MLWSRGSHAAQLFRFSGKEDFRTAASTGLRQLGIHMLVKMHWHYQCYVVQIAEGTDPGTKEGGGKLQKKGHFTKIEAYANKRQLKKG